MLTPVFKPFPKISRITTLMTVTEKIDGTNACVIVTEDGGVFAQSRNRIITPDDDNFGFAKWVKDREDDLRELGPGYHYGEWWGLGIQRGYGLNEKRFSLFNTERWGEDRPACCHVVPVLSQWQFSIEVCSNVIATLHAEGSRAAPGFMDPEGIMIYCHGSNSYFKWPFEESHKSQKAGV